MTTLALPMPPLLRHWCLYMNVRTSAGLYANGIVPAYDVSTTEDLWSMLRSMPSVDRFFGTSKTLCHEGADVVGFSLFADGVQPKWEDVANAAGCEWGLRAAVPLKALAAAWEELVLLAVGGSIEPDPRASRVTGVRVVDKSHAKVGVMVKLEVWMTSVSTECREDILRRVMALPTIASLGHSFALQQHTNKAQSTAAFLKRRKHAGST